jgi:hypothetical protein
MLNTAGASSNPVESRFAEPLSPSRVDGLGERWITGDSAGALELLRFRGEVASAPGFETALRRQVAALAQFKDPSFAAVREVVQDAGQLTLVSAHVIGPRLSDLSTTISKGKRAIFVARVLRDATRALAELEALGNGVTHAALTADRIVVTPEGRIYITEHVLASALQELALWPEELWTEFGLLSRADEDGEAIFDSRTTVMQLAVVAVSVLLSRQITLQDFEHRLPALLEEFSSLFSSSSSVVVSPLREWLERALHLGSEPYRSMAEADAGLRKLLAALGPGGAVELDTLQFPSRTDAPVEKSDKRSADEQNADPMPSRPRLAERDRPMARAVAVIPAAAVPMPAPAAEIMPDARSWRRPDAHTVTNEDAPAWAGWRSAWPREQYVMWAAIALVVIAVGEAIAITRLMLRPPTVVLTDSSIVVESPQPGGTVMVDGKPVGSTPVKIRVNPKTQAIRLIAAPPPAPIIDPTAIAAKAESDRTAATLNLAAARQRTGGLQIKAPINLNVLEGDRVLGSTADGPIVASAGSHQLDFVNTALGFRVRQSITIRAGVISPLTITPPMGRISINAQPWAQVLIDDTAVGETPLANVQVPIGEHQITFRHPQMGERRERVTVRADAPARISTTFQR